MTKQKICRDCPADITGSASRRCESCKVQHKKAITQKNRIKWKMLNAVLRAEARLP